MPTASAANNNIERVLDEYLSPSPPPYLYVCVGGKYVFYDFMLSTFYA